MHVHVHILQYSFHIFTQKIWRQSVFTFFRIFLLRTVWDAIEELRIQIWISTHKHTPKHVQCTYRHAQKNEKSNRNLESKTNRLSWLLTESQSNISYETFDATRYFSVFSYFCLKLDIALHFVNEVIWCNIRVYRLPEWIWSQTFKSKLNLPVFHLEFWRIRLVYLVFTCPHTKSDLSAYL